MEVPSDYGRVKYVDVLKGFIIITIVFLHIIFSKKADAGAPAIPLQALYFGLIAFFLISGYYYRPNRGFAANMGKRLKQLLVSLAICAIVLPVILYIWITLWGQNPGLDDYLFALQWGSGNLCTSLDTAWVYPMCGSCVGYYFIWGMLFGFIIFYALADYVMDDWRKYGAVIAILLVIVCVQSMYCRYTLIFNCYTAPIAAVFMFAGAALAKVKVVERIDLGSPKNLKFWYPFVGCLIGGIVMVYLFPPGTYFDILYFGEYEGLSVFPYFVEAVLFFIVFLYISKLVAMIPYLSEVFKEAGKHTLGTLLLHGFVASFIIATFCPLTTTSWFPSDLTMMQRIPVAFATVIICYLICRFGPQIVSKMTDKSAERSINRLS